MDSFTQAIAIKGAAIQGAIFIIFTTTLAFVPKNATFTRLFATIALFTLEYLLHHVIVELPLWPSQQTNLVAVSWTACIAAAEAVFVSKVDANDLSDGKGHPRPGPSELLKRAFALYFNFRRVGTKWEIARLRRRKPQSKARFLAAQFAQLVVIYLIVDALMIAPGPEPHLIAEEKQTLWRFSNLSAEDVAFRLIGSLVYWFISFTVNRLNITLRSFSSVLLGFTRPEDWVHHNGHISACYTVRGFWGTFWHQLLRKLLTGWSDFISDKILRLRRGTLLSRYMRIFLSFFISGVMHHAMEPIFGMGHKEMAGIKFFSLQPVGIIAEDFVQWLSRDWPIPRPIRRTIGYIWVLAFLWWSTPVWFYPTVRAGPNGEHGRMVPISVMEAFL